MGEFASQQRGMYKVKTEVGFVKWGILKGSSKQATVYLLQHL